ncbi:hemoglobin [Pseudoalteromonas distincta]|uniref:Globin n=2 Tax=Pseudoalteromonas TaxID=53246 RepID=A0ABT9GDI1_9GAMM|nr:MULTISPECIES: globin domain-containing protein [Pseudoalteromonas distincta group]KHM50744.1 hemoglobin [Pseudoalteromonas elyakovii]KID35017.1 hemoglobin [Pseudoalteromonas distincta]MDP4483934.1 globin [Pseudoalteromonas elyakovii]
MNQQQSALLNNLTIIKPNFHAFTAKFHSKLAQSCIEMNYPTALQFNEKSFTLFCVLERIVKHLDKPASVAPFLAHHLMYLKKSGASHSDIALLSNAFYETLEEHLGKHFTTESQLAWKKALRYFESFASNVLFNVTNVVSLQQRMQQKQSNKI